VLTYFGIAANILIHEEGRLEICDFGVAGILQSQRDKRSTWIGTPHWMPPEMFGRGGAHRYSSEIDVWAYGCTLYEFANGTPPNAGLREPMQIGRQLNRTAPKLNNDNYSQGLQELIAFALEPNPANRPTMADILEHPYIAGTEEEYPTSSVSELVRNYYQWSQRGGQRISLFNPGGAAAAEMPDAEEIIDDWNFSTTDGFERRFSVIDLDEIAASLAEMEESTSPTTPASEHDFGEDVNVTDMGPEQKANFDERVRRGAAAMEGLFNEEMPSYKYETKNDFVPIQPAPPTSDLPLRTETDRSSVMSTLIDIDIGSFDSSHYAAGAPTAQPFQLANADTIRANRSSLRLHRNSNESSSQSSGGGPEGDESQEEEFQPQTGPRPPTMDWKFPSFGPPPEPEDQPEAKAEEAPASESAPEEPLQAEKRATMQWTFPVMGANAASDAVNSDRYDTLRAPLPGIQERQSDAPGESRPSTSASNKSTMSDSDYDPFRFDRPKTPQAPLHQSTLSFGSDTLGDPSDDVEDDSPGILDGPGPDEEDQPSWSETSSTIDPNDESPLPTAVPVLDGPGESPIIASEPGSPVYEEPLQTARRDVASMAMSQATTLKEHDSDSLSFPSIIPPSAESLMEGIDDNTVTAELDRLLGDFLGALAATGDALSRASSGHQTDEVNRATEASQ
jgi:serine/threonine protein kinase